MLSPLSAIVLAGGHSQRLGVDKTRLTLGRPETLLHNACRIAGCVASEILVVGVGCAHSGLDHQYNSDVRWLMDRYPQAGPLGGMLTGLEQASNRYCLVVAGDMPFLNPTLLGSMVKTEQDYDALVPSFQGYLEPLHAVYNRSCIEPIRKLVMRRQKRVVDFLPEIRARYFPEEEARKIDPFLESFFNVNTIEQLAQAWVIAASRPRTLPSQEGGQC